LIDIIKRRRWQMIGHTLRHGDELHSLITEGKIEGINQDEDLGRDTLAK
jgi:hypothetical protein